VATDKFSLFVSGGVFDGYPTAEQAVELFVTSVSDNYERVTYDLGANFRSVQFKSTLERLGTQAWAVPANAHWPSVAEKSIDLLRLELDAVYEECPEASARCAFSAAAHRLNGRATWAHDTSRQVVHFGRQPQAPHLFAQAPAWLPPSMSQVDHFLSLCDEKRQAHVVHTARARVRSALRRRLSQPDPIVLMNGDLFLYWRTGLGASQSGYKGPAICLGAYRALVVGIQGGHVVTAHVSRCILHQRGPYHSSDNMSFVPTFPDRRDRTLEDPATIADLSALKDAGDTDDSKAPSDDFVLDNPASEIVQAPEHANSGAVVYLEAATSGGVLDREFIGPPSQKPQLSETPERLADGPKPDTPSDESSELSDLVLGDAVNASNSTIHKSEVFADAPRSVPGSSSVSKSSQPIKSLEPLSAAKNKATMVDNPIILPALDQPILPAWTPNAELMPGLPDVPLITEDYTPGVEPPITAEIPVMDVLKSEVDSTLGTEATLDIVDAGDMPKFDDFSLDPEAVRKRQWSSLASEGNEDSRKRTRRFLTCVNCFVPMPNGVGISSIYLVNYSRKRTVVVDISKGLEMPEMRAEMDRGIASFHNMDCIDTVNMAKVPRGANLVTSRWVFTIKTKEDGTRRYKARLVARGFEDDEKANVTRDSPTAANSSHRLVLQLLVEKQWNVTSWDFETAFLQGNPITRDVFISAPSGYAPVDACWRLK
jgi:Reverse transcriptase (RNA-dependent DNA polymerase)